MSELKHESALREVSVSAVTVNDDDDLDALLGGGVLKEQEIAEIANMLLDNLDNVDAFAVDAFADDWILDDQQFCESKTPEIIKPNSLVNELAADRDRIHKELEDLRSQHQFECEYVDQLEQEIISVSTERDRQVTEITTQLEQLQSQFAKLQSKLSEVTTQRDKLEEELIQHLSNQAQLHQSLRGLENEYVTDLTRVQELEQQVEELQNQVLHQASKASEHEAAIQHWKEQSVRHQHHALQLSGALDRLLVERPVRHLTEPIQNESTYAQGYRSERSLESLPESTPVRSWSKASSRGLAWAFCSSRRPISSIIRS